MEFLLSALIALAPATQSGQASWYGQPDSPWWGGKTASGKQFDGTKPYCAHRELEFGTVLIIQSQHTGQLSICIVEDRGPYEVVDGEAITDPDYPHSRFLDMSRRVAKTAGVREVGVSKVRVWSVNPRLSRYGLQSLTRFVQKQRDASLRRWLALLGLEGGTSVASR